MTFPIIRWNFIKIMFQTTNQIYKYIYIWVRYQWFCKVGPIPGNIRLYHHCTIVAVQVFRTTPRYRNEKRHFTFQVGWSMKVKTCESNQIIFEDLLSHRNEMQRKGLLHHQPRTIQLKSCKHFQMRDNHSLAPACFYKNRSPWIGTTNQIFVRPFTDGFALFDAKRGDFIWNFRVFSLEHVHSDQYVCMYVCLSVCMHTCMHACAWMYMDVRM